MFNFGGGMPGGHGHSHGGGEPADTTKFYETLGIAKSADGNAVKKTYRRNVMIVISPRSKEKS
jgi:hypothetical protein